MVYSFECLVVDRVVDHTGCYKRYRKRCASSMNSPKKSFICLIFGLILVFTLVSTAHFAPPVQMFRHHALRRRRRWLRPLTTDGEALERGVL